MNDRYRSNAMKSLEMALKAGFVQQHSGSDVPTNWYWAHPAEIEQLVLAVQAGMQERCAKGCDCAAAIRALE